MIPDELKAQLKSRRKSNSLPDHILKIEGDFDIDHVLLTYYRDTGLIGKRRSVYHAIFLLLVSNDIKRVGRGKYKVVS